MKERRQSRHRQRAQILCTPFFVDVTIVAPKSHYKQLWRKEKQKVKKQKKRYSRVLSKKAAAEQAMYGHIARSIKQRVRKYHSIGDLELVIPAIAPYLWRKMMRSWQDYIPQRRRTGFYHYKKTHNTTIFLASFPGTELEKQVAVDMRMRITLGTKVAARAMYNRKDRKMILNFYYEPYPFPMNWFPMFRKGTSPAKGQFMHKKCWLEKVPKCGGGKKE